MVAVVTRPSGIVKTNLIAYIDASNSSSYSGSGSTINDLSGQGATATLNGTYSFVSAGQASYWNFATGASTNYISSTLTQNYMDCTLVFYPDFTYNSGASLAYGLGTGTATDKTMRFTNANGTGPWSVINPDNTDGWASSSTTYYINGTPNTGSANLASGWNIVGATRTNTTNGAFASNWAYYWGTGYSGRYYQGRVAAILLYSAALLPWQQLQNFSALRGRFGI
jgi:hypothetical protein